MENYKKMYLTLFNRITDAISVIDNGGKTESDMYNSLLKAKNILVKAQQDTEEMYISDGEDE